MPSRRTVLRAGAAGGLAAGAGTLWATRTGPIRTTDPPPDTWPQHRRDAANTARADHSVPAGATVEWERDAISDSIPSLVVGTDRVYVCGDGIAALSRTDGEVEWRVDAVGSTLALADVESDAPTLYVAHGRANDDELNRRDAPALRAYDATDGTERWRRSLPTLAYDVLVTDARVILGCHGTLLAVDRNGSRRWRLEPEGLGRVYPMVHEGTLYAGLPGYVRRYRRGRVLGSLLGTPFSVDWTGEDTSGPAPPTVAGELLLMGSEQAYFEGDDPVVYAFDRGSGERAWSAGPRTETLRRALTPVQFGTVALTAFYSHGQEAAGDSGRIAGLDLQDGSRRFSLPVEEPLWCVAAGSDCAVFGGEDSELRAVRPDGRERWHVDTAAAVTDVAVLDGQVLAARRDGHVVAFE